jgi:hypothetical protein
VIDRYTPKVSSFPFVSAPTWTECMMDGFSSLHSRGAERGKGGRRSYSPHSRRGRRRGSCGSVRTGKNRNMEKKSRMAPRTHLRKGPACIIDEPPTRSCWRQGPLFCVEREFRRGVSYHPHDAEEKVPSRPESKSGGGSGPRDGRWGFTWASRPTHDPPRLRVTAGHERGCSCTRRRQRRRRRRRRRRWIGCAKRGRGTDLSPLWGSPTPSRQSHAITHPNHLPPRPRYPGLDATRYRQRGTEQGCWAGWWHASSEAFRSVDEWGGWIGWCWGGGGGGLGVGAPRQRGYGCAC